jgi:uncharacterized membrane protein YgaE (UPF0421/DUF939 family)
MARARLIPATAAWPRGTVRAFARRLLLVGWPGTRIVKTGIATAVAWLAGNAIGDAAPLFAVFGALNGMKPTVAGSLRATGGALVGIVLGTLLAAASEGLVSAPRPVIVGLLMVVGLVVSVRLNAYALLGTEVAVTGLLVYALSQGNIGWGAGRFAETAIGGGIAIVLNAFIMPPDYRADARHATSVLADALIEHFQTAIRDAMLAPAEQEAADHLESARTAALQADALIAQTARAAEAMRFSPVLRYRPYRRVTPEEIDRYMLGVDALAAGLTHTRAASRAAFHATRRPRRLPPPSTDWRGLCAAVGSGIEAFERYVLDGSETALEAADQTLHRALKTHAEVVAAGRLPAEPLDIDRAAVLAETEHVLDDLRRALVERSAKAASPAAPEA